MPTRIANAIAVTTVQGGAFAPGQGSLGQGLLAIWDMTPGGQTIPNQAPGQSALTLQLGSTAGVDTNDPQPYLEDSGKRNLFVNSEPLLAQTSHSATVTQANFTEAGLTNGIQFPAAAQIDSAYLANFSLVNSATYTLSIYVVMNDGSVPVVGNAISSCDFALTLGNTITSPGVATVTLISGTLYRVSWTSTNASWPSPVNNGVTRYAAQSGKAFRVTGYQLEQSPVMTAYQPVGASWPTKTPVTSFVTDDYILSPTIPQLSMAGDWTVYLCGKFDGATNMPFSIANPAAADQSLYLGYSAAGAVKINAYNVGQTASSAMTVPAASYVVLAFKSAAGTLTLGRLDGAVGPVSLANSSPTGTPRLGLGCLARSSVLIADSLKLALPVLLYSRATTSAEDARILRWYRDKGKQIGLPIL